MGRPLDNEDFWGFAGDRFDWQNSPSGAASEVFADMYTGWVYSSWKIERDGDENPILDENGNQIITGYGQNRAKFMEYMSNWIEATIKNEN